jgi:hypothetical protein
MPKIPECDRCLLYSHNPHLVCAVHPGGVDGNSCLDFREDPNAQAVELWEPEGAQNLTATGQRGCIGIARNVAGWMIACRAIY